MLCEKCNVRQAERKVTQTIDGRVKTTYFCAQCCDSMMERRIEEIPRCKYCGRTIDEIMETWIVGCEKCYDRFADKLDPIIKSVQKVDKL